MTRGAGAAVIFAALLAVVLAAAYLPSLGGGYTNWDDPDYTYASRLALGAPVSKALTSFALGHYHPLTELSLRAEAVTLGERAAVRRAVSLFLHLANSLLFFFILSALGLGFPAAAAGALLWALHPAHTEAVAWIAERKTLLYVFFYLAAMLAYLRRPLPASGGAGAAVWGLFALSLLSKAPAVTLPAALIGLDWLKGRPLDRENGAEKGLMLCLSLAFALSSTSDEAKGIVDDVGFFQDVKASLVKGTGTRTPSDVIDMAVRQIVQGAIISDQIIDIFDAVGLKKPDISILSDEFLAEVRKIPQKNLAVELLNRLLKDETRKMRKSNATQSKAFSAMLEEAISKYQNRAVSTAQVIELLIEMAKQMQEAQRRGKELGLNEAELAFYDALETNDSAVQVLGDEVLKSIARDITDTINNNLSIDWSVRESARANIRRLVKRVLRRYDYPPDKQEAATKNVMEQAELLCGEMAV